VYVHKYPLHCRVTAACVCCELTNDFVFGSPTDVVIYKGCRRRHVGDIADARQLRESDHAALYLSEIQLLHAELADARAEQRDDYQRELATLQRQLESRTDELAHNAEVISGLRAAPRDGQLGSGLAEWPADEELSEAQAERA
jgi:hypothetical protein